MRNGEPFLRRSKFFHGEPQGIVGTVINLVLYVPNNGKTIPHVYTPRNRARSLWIDRLSPGTPGSLIK